VPDGVYIAGDLVNGELYINYAEVNSLFRVQCVLKSSILLRYTPLAFTSRRVIAQTISEPSVKCM
jgi:hypothetical protein